MTLAPIDCVASMDRAVFAAFQPGGSFNAVLDHLTVNTMNFAREADGTTPLMAACARGNRPLVELLLDLGCQAMIKDERGWSAVEHAAACPEQQDLGKLILERVLPPLDASGKPVHAWDTCKHANEHRFLDESLGWLICTNCALVLDEKALMMAEADSAKNPWAVRGADAEYNNWRHDELEIADAMRALGVVDNVAAKNSGLESSVWKQRERALGWLDKRRRVIVSWRDRARMMMASNAGQEREPVPAIPQYPAEIASMSAPSERRHDRKLINSAPLQQQRFRGTKVQEVEEEEELYDPRAMQDALGDPFYLVTSWRKCLARWKGVCRAAVKNENYKRAGLLPSIAEETEEHKNANRETEIEYEIEMA